MTDQQPNRYRWGWLIVLGCGLAYLLWIGWHWLALPLSGQELAGSASRVWDVKRELTEHGQVPWWSTYFMGGSSYGINHARGFYLVPWILLSTVFDMVTAGKVMALLAMAAGALGMYCCARYFLKQEWASVLAALVYLLHPAHLIRAGWHEHMTIILFMGFVPWLWLALARALDSGRGRDIAVCVLVAVGAFWADNKQAVIMGVFLACYIVVKLVQAGRSGQKGSSGGGCCGSEMMRVARTAALTAVGAGLLGVGLIVPGVMESKHVKLFEGEPMAVWQKGFSFKSMLGLVDRDGVVINQVVEGVMNRARVTQFQDVPMTQRAAVQERVNRIGGMRADAPEKYAGLVLLGLVVAAALYNRRRFNQWGFWFFIGMLMLSVMLATGPATVLGAHGRSWMTIFGLPGVPVGVKMVVLVLVGLVVWGLVMLFRRKVTSNGKLGLVLGVLAVFLFLPGFDILSRVPFFGDIRAPFAFYDVPSVMFLAMLAGFFVTDVVVGSQWESRMPHVVAGVAVLLLVDFWPYQRPLKATRISARSIENLQQAYEVIGKDAERFKCFAFSGRYYHLLGPMWSDKPQADEAFYNWMSPRGMGLLNRAKWDPITYLPSFMQMANVRYVVFDKIDPGLPANAAGSMLNLLRKTFPEVAVENDDFIVLRNDTANPFVSAFPMACLYVGDHQEVARLALGLGFKYFPLVQARERHLNEVDFTKLDGVAALYLTGEEVLHMALVPKEWSDRVFPWVTDRAPSFPEKNSVSLRLPLLQVDRVDAGHIKIDAESQDACWLVVAESWFPYWRAEIDGQPAELLLVNGAMMGVRMPAGKHQITLIYEIPRAYKIAGAVSGLALLALIGVILAGWRRNGEHPTLNSER